MSDGMRAVWDGYNNGFKINTYNEIPIIILKNEKEIEEYEKELDRARILHAVRCITSSRYFAMKNPKEFWNGYKEEEE